MTEPSDQIRAALTTHEYLAPDATEVYTRAQELARTYRRRRIVAQGAGGAVLSVGLVAGGLNLPTLLQGGHSQTKVIDAGSAPAATTAPPSPEELKRDLAAYFGAGYGLQNAEELAKLWNMSSQPSDLSAVKAEAGSRLLAGQKLPVKPEAVVDVDPKEAAAVGEFFKAGYNYDDAVTLAKLWKTANPYEAKALAGQKLLAGEELPIKP
jgi:hypothetical protein